MNTVNNTYEGANCVIVGKRLIVSVCPLAKGSCFWQHSETHKCTYSVDADLRVQELAARTGVHTPTDAEIQILRNKLLYKIKESL